MFSCQLPAFTTSRMNSWLLLLWIVVFSFCPITQTFPILFSVQYFETCITIFVPLIYYSIVPVVSCSEINPYPYIAVTLTCPCMSVSWNELVQPEIQLNIFCDNHTYIFFSVYLVTLLDVTHAIETVTNFPAICVTLYLHWTACARCRWIIYHALRLNYFPGTIANVSLHWPAVYRYV